LWPELRVEISAMISELFAAAIVAGFDREKRHYVGSASGVVPPYAPAH